MTVTAATQLTLLTCTCTAVSQNKKSTKLFPHLFSQPNLSINLHKTPLLSGHKICNGHLSAHLIQVSPAETLTDIATPEFKWRNTSYNWFIDQWSLTEQLTLRQYHWFQKSSIPPPRKEFFLRPLHLSGNSSQASDIYLNFGTFKNPPPPGISNPFRGESMDIFWNYTMSNHSSASMKFCLFMVHFL